MSYEEIKIGALYPLTGKFASIGESVRKALEFYVNLVNNQYLLQCSTRLRLPDLGNAKIKLVWADTQGDQMIALAEARRLIEVEGVTSIIGSYQSTVSSAVSLLTEVLQVPYVSPDTDAGILTKRGLRWFFKTGTDDRVYTNALYNVLMENVFCNSTVGALAENTLLGQEEVVDVINLSYKYRYDLTAMELYDTSLIGLKEKIISIENANPDFLFCGQVIPSPVDTLEYLKELDYYPMALLDQTSEYTLSYVLEKAGRDVDYVISAVPWAIGVTKINPLAKQVNDMFRAIYGEDFDAVNSASFTGIYTLIDAIARAESNTPGAIRQALVDTNIPGKDLIMPWRGVRFNNFGGNIFACSIVVQIFNSTLKIVWPECLAETKVIIPAPPWSNR